jgi:predicted nucleotidyltransferase
MKYEIPPEFSLTSFAKKHNKNWNGIIEAIKLTQKNRESVTKILSPNDIPLTSSDADVVLFGSIARNECTHDSDIDWTLLVDGQADAKHYNLSFDVNQKLKDTGLAQPGTSGMFGQITYSHNLIHKVGGEDDTNHNLTRRILLLLESEKIQNVNNSNSITSYNRVLRGIIGQYIDNDSGFRSDRGNNVPRFLLNDVIRFWRTMCVDFAYKQKEQFGEKWGLRNIKLRTSRKLIYVKGLLMCYCCYKNGDLKDKDSVKEFLESIVHIKPLEFILSVLLKNKVNENVILNLLDSYSEFLEHLNDPVTRDGLKSINMYTVYDNPIFMKARSTSDRFQESLDNIFLGNEVKEFTFKYTIF